MFKIIFIKVCYFRYDIELNYFYCTVCYCNVFLGKKKHFLSLKKVCLQSSLVRVGSTLSTVDTCIVVGLLFLFITAKHLAVTAGKV